MAFQKCQKCEKPATHKFTRIVDGQAVDFYFCPEHAGEFSPLQKKHQAAQMNLAELLAGLLKSEQGQKPEPDAEEADLRCPKCGQTYRQYRKTMLLGCSHCYRTFEKQLAQDLRKYHGTVRHRGKQQASAEGDVTLDDKIDALRKRLALAVDDEDFELAAQLRDQIRQLTSAARKEVGG
jgi:protein arginine kinase activator